MAERASTPEEIAAWAAALRGGQAKQEFNEAIVEALHPPPDPPEPEPAETKEPEQAHNELIARLLSPKAAQAELIRRLHPDKGGEW